MCEGVERGGLEGKIVAVIMISGGKYKVLLDTCSGSNSLLFLANAPTPLHMFDTSCLEVRCCIVVLGSARRRRYTRCCRGSDKYAK